jgi:superfamily II DNA or RNA helicase
MIEFDYHKQSQKLIIKGDKSIIDIVREHFSVNNDGARFIPGRRKFFMQRKYAITGGGKAELGLFAEINDFIYHKFGITPTISPELEKILGYNKDYSLYLDFIHTLRDYQVESLDRALKAGRGTFVLGTGAGKTLLTAALAENYYRLFNKSSTFKCLIIVPDLGLVTQTYNEFIDVGVTCSVSKWTGSNELDLTSNIIICNAGILQSQFESIEELKYVDVLIVDEAHKVKHENKIGKIITDIRTHRKFGVTGTMPESKFDVWSIIGKLGPVLYVKPSHELRQEKFLTDVTVNILEIDYGRDTPPRSSNRYRAEIEFLIRHEKRNDVIKKLAGKLSNNTLILVNYIEHGEILYDLLSSSLSKKVYFIRGSVDVEDREKIKAIIESSDDVICVAISAIFSTGVNIKNLHNIIFASGGKSFIRTVQSIGRGLRLHSTKTKLNIIDIADILTYSESHGLKRRDIYDKEKIQYKSTILKL